MDTVFAMLYSYYNLYHNCKNIFLMVLCAVGLALCDRRQNIETLMDIPIYKESDSSKLKK